MKYTDPSGHFSLKKILHKIKKAVSKAWESSKKAVQKTWKAVKKPVIAAAMVVATAYLFGGTAALLAKGTLVSAASSATTSVAFDTGEGRQLVRRAGKEFFDDVLGMSPKTAYVASSIILPALTSAALEHALGWALADKGTIGLRKAPPGHQPLSGTGTGFGDPPAAEITAANLKMMIVNGEYIGDLVTRPVKNPFWGALGFLHVDAQLVEGMKQLTIGTNEAIWGWSTYICHSAYSLEVLQQGYFSSAIMVDPTNWTAYFSSTMLGTYGGRGYLTTATGFNAAEKYEEK